MADYDIIILGGGPAGLTAGLYAGRRSMKTLVLGELTGGQMSFAPRIENYPGIASISGMELTAKMAEQAKSFGCEIRAERVIGLDLKQEQKVVRTDAGEYRARAVIIATGAGHKKLEIPGEDRFLGHGLSYCATCDAVFFKGKRVAVIGGSDSAVVAALVLADAASETYLIHRRDELRAEEANRNALAASKVKVLWSTVVKEIKGADRVEALVLESTKTGAQSELAVDGLFIYAGTVPATELVKQAGVALDEKGFVIVTRKQETNIPGVYAAGDACGGILQISQAVGQGAVAAVNAYLSLKK
jgi:thioredoxin reductase (NADPH)